MKCPKCGFFGPDHLDICKKCGIDLSKERAKLGLNRFRRRSSRSQEAAQEESLHAETLREENFEPALQKTRTEAVIPPPVPPSIESQEVVQKDLELPQKTVALQPEQLKEQPGDAEDDSFQFGTEDDDFHASPLEKTINMKDLREDTGPAEDSSDDFEFPDLGESKPPSDVFSGESDDLSTTMAMPDMAEAESPFAGPLAADDESEDSFDDKTLASTEISLGDDDVSVQTGEMLREEAGMREDTGTVLLKAEEVEDILQSEIPPLDEGPEGLAGDRTNTELLREDELSKILEDFDADSSKTEA